MDNGVNMGQFFSSMQLVEKEKPLTFNDLLLAVTDPNYHEETEEDIKQKTIEILKQVKLQIDDPSIFKNHPIWKTYNLDI